MMETESAIQMGGHTHVRPHTRARMRAHIHMDEEKRNASCVG